MPVRVKDITYKLHKRRQKMEPSIELRRKYLAATFARQVQSEKDMITSAIGRMQHGVQRALLASRLSQLNNE